MSTNYYKGLREDQEVPYEWKRKHIDETFEEYAATPEYFGMSAEDRAVVKNKYIEDALGEDPAAPKTVEDSWGKVIGQSVAQGALATSELIAEGGQAIRNVAGMPESQFRRNVATTREVIGEPTVEPGGVKSTVGQATRALTEMGTTALTSAGQGVLPQLTGRAGVSKFNVGMEEGAGGLRSGAAGAVAAVGEYITEKIPLGVLTNKYGQTLVNRLLTGIVADSGGESLATLIEMAIADPIIGKKHTAEEIKTAMIDAAKVGATMMGAGVAVTQPFVGADSKLTKKQQDQKQADFDSKAEALNAKNVEGEAPLGTQLGLPGVAPDVQNELTPIPQEEGGLLPTEGLPIAEEPQVVSPSGQSLIPGQETLPGIESVDTPIETFVDPKTNVPVATVVDSATEGEFKIQFPEEQKELWKEASIAVQNNRGGLKTPMTKEIKPLAQIIEAATSAVEQISKFIDPKLPAKERKLKATQAVAQGIEQGEIILPKNVEGVEGGELGILTHTMNNLGAKFTRESTIPAEEGPIAETPKAEKPEVKKTKPTVKKPVKKVVVKKEPVVKKVPKKAVITIEAPAGEIAKPTKAPKKGDVVEIGGHKVEYVGEQKGPDGSLHLFNPTTGPSKGSIFSVKKWIASEVKKRMSESPQAKVADIATAVKEVKTAAEMAVNLAKTTKNKALKTILTRIAGNINPRHTISLKQPVTAKAHGSVTMTPNSKGELEDLEVRISPKIFTKEPLKAAKLRGLSNEAYQEMVVAHELMHAAVNEVIYSVETLGTKATKGAKSAFKDLKNTHTSIIKALKTASKDATSSDKAMLDFYIEQLSKNKKEFTNYRELVTYSMTDSKFQQVLTDLKVEGNKTGLQKFAETLKKMLKLPVKTSALIDMIQITDDLLIAGKTYTSKTGKQTRGDKAKFTAPTTFVEIENIIEQGEVKSLTVAIHDRGVEEAKLSKQVKEGTVDAAELQDFRNQTARLKDMLRGVKSEQVEGTYKEFAIVEFQGPDSKKTEWYIMDLNTRSFVKKLKAKRAAHMWINDYYAHKAENYELVNEVKAEKVKKGVGLKKEVAKSLQKEGGAQMARFAYLGQKDYKAFDKKDTVDVTHHLPEEGFPLPHVGRQKDKGRMFASIWVPFIHNGKDYSKDSPFQFSVAKKDSNNTRSIVWTGSKKLGEKFKTALAAIQLKEFKTDKAAYVEAENILRTMVEMHSGKDMSGAKIEESDIIMKKRGFRTWYTRLKGKFGGKSILAPIYSVYLTFDKKTGEARFYLQREQLGEPSSYAPVGEYDKDGKFNHISERSEIKGWLADKANELGGFDNIITTLAVDDLNKVFTRTQQRVEAQPAKKVEKEIEYDEQGHADVMLLRRELQDRLDKAQSATKTGDTLKKAEDKVKDKQTDIGATKAMLDAMEDHLEDRRGYGDNQKEISIIVGVLNERRLELKELNNKLHKAEKALELAKRADEKALNTAENLERVALETTITEVDKAIDNNDFVLANNLATSTLETTAQELRDKVKVGVTRTAEADSNKRRLGVKLKAQQLAKEEGGILESPHEEGKLGYDQAHPSWTQEAATSLDGKVIYSRQGDGVDFAVIETDVAGNVTYSVVEFKDLEGVVEKTQDAIMTQRLFGKEVDARDTTVESATATIKQYSHKLISEPETIKEVRSAIDKVRESREELRTEPVPVEAMKTLKKQLKETFTGPAYKTLFNNPNITFVNTAKENGGKVVQVDPQRGTLSVAVTTLNEQKNIDQLIDALAQLKMYRDGIFTNGILKKTYSKISKQMNMLSKVSTPVGKKLKALITKEKKRLAPSGTSVKVINEEVVVKFMNSDWAKGSPLYKTIMKATKEGMVAEGIKRPTEAQAKSYLEQAMKYDRLPFRNNEQVDQSMDKFEEMMAGDVLGKLVGFEHDSEMDARTANNSVVREEIEKEMAARVADPQKGSTNIKSGLGHRIIGGLVPYYWRSQEFKSLRQKAGRSLKEGFHKVYELGHKFRGEATKAIHNETKILKDFFDKDVDSNPEFFNQLNEVVWVLDRLKTRPKGLPQKFTTAVDEGGKTNLIAPSEDYYNKLEDYVNENFDASKEVVDTYVQVRQVLDKNLMDLYNDVHAYRAKKGNTSNKIIEDFIRNMGMIEFYFPHMRFGNHFVELKYKGETIYRSQFDMNPVVERAKKMFGKGFNKLSNAQKVDMLNLTNSEALKGVDLKSTDFTIDSDRVKDENMYDMYANPLPVEVLHQIMDETSSNLKSEYGSDGESGVPKFIQAMEQEVNRVAVRKRGMKGFFTERKDIAGHATQPEDLKQILLSYIMSMNTSRTNLRAVDAFTSELKKIDWKTNKEEWKVADSYVGNYFKNANRLVSGLKKVVFFKYLGFNLNTIAQNMTQPTVTALPRLASDVGMKDSALAALTKAYHENLRDSRSVEKGKGRTLNEGQRKLVKELIESGEASDQFVRELMGNVHIGAALGGNWDKLVQASGKWMGKAEKLNRVVVALASYDLATSGAITNKLVTDRFDVKPGQPFTHEQAVDYAKEVNSATQFDYGRDNIPAFFKAHPALEALYIFQSFPINMIANMRHHIANNGKRGVAAVAMMMASLLAWGGEEAIPGYGVLDVLMSFIAGDDWEEKHRQWLEDTTNKSVATMLTKGLPTQAGIDFSNSMSINLMPYFKTGDTFEDKLKSFLWSKTGPGIAGLIGDMSKATSALAGNNTNKAIEHILPAFAAAPFKAYQGMTDAVRSKSGTPLKDAKSESNYQYNAAEAILKGLNLPIASEQKIRDKQSSIYKLEAFKKSFSKKLVTGFRTGKYSTEEVLDKLEKWNESRPHLFINPKYVLQSMNDIRRPKRSRRLLENWLDN